MGRRMVVAAIRPNRLSYAVALALASLASSQVALAQDSASTAPAPGAGSNAEVTQVLVVATRRSQQSSIDRKKHAATAMDSIVAEDVGSLPDRNVGEAISRMSGVALDRGDYGEGVSVSVRGNGPDLTRVELDGQAVQSAGGTDMLGGGNGRGVEFRQLSADLIKSVDVVKGSTADMTEGSLGGGINIKTRTGLDFKKPFASVRASSSQSSLNKKWSPDFNAILADKFLNGRLGLLLNASSSELANESHSFQVAQTAQQGYYRLVDFDNSPQKTFTFQPQTVNAADSNATNPLFKGALAAGGAYNSLSPLDMITRAAAAQSKEECRTAFPNLSDAEVRLLAPSSVAGARAARGNELLNCLAQWNDYTPSNVRNWVKRENDKRQNLDLRADFKVNNQLTLYTKGSYNKRNIEFQQLTYGPGDHVKVNQTRTIQPDYVGPTFVDNNTTRTRSAVPGSGYYRYDLPTGVSNNSPLNGTVVNIDPASVVVDANHHLTKYTISDGVFATDQLIDRAQTTTRYLQAGGAYKNGGLTAEFFVGDSASEFRRDQSRFIINNYVGDVTLEALPSGLWNYTVPTGFDQAANASQLFPATSNLAAAPLSATNTRATPAYTIAQQPKLTQALNANWLPQLRETSERTAKLDLTYNTPDRVPLFSRFKAGFNLRDTQGDVWDPNAMNRGGVTLKAAVGTFGQPGYVAPVVLPAGLVRGTFIGCENTPGSLAPGGQACQYGVTASANPNTGADSTLTVTPQQFKDFVNQVLVGRATATQFFRGAKDRPAELLDNWTEIDVAKAFALVNAPNQNYDCIKGCLANDGKHYEQPYQHFQERTEALYIMGDFKVDEIPFTGRALPFGWEIDGNIGFRYVRNRVYGTGAMTFTSIMTTPSYDPAPSRRELPSGMVRNSVTQNTTVDATSHDTLPSFNAAMWMVPDQLVLRYNRAKTVARPPVAQLLPSATCIYDERLVIDDPVNAVQLCTGVIGNPALRARTNTNQNVSAEWYPNKDTMVSVSVFHQKGKIGAAIPFGLANVPLFEGSDLTIPPTDVKVSDLAFNYSTYMNAASVTRKGLEIGGKTAFTFLPWFLRYTGMDLNYTKLRSATGADNVVDLLTGTPLPPAREPDYSYNAALWYDDGRLSARIAVQAVGQSFNCVAGCLQGGMRNYPSAATAAGTIVGAAPYSPGSPNFKDATRFIDAKISWKWSPGIEVFAEGRNLGNATQTQSQGPYSPFSDGTPNILDYAYVGRRIMLGVNFRTM